MHDYFIRKAVNTARKLSFSLPTLDVPGYIRIETPYAADISFRAGKWRLNRYIPRGPITGLSRG